MRKPADESLLKAMAAELKGRRLALAISQEELADRAGVNRTFVGKLEVAQSQPSLTVLFHLSEALNIHVVDFVAGVVKRAAKERRGRAKTSLRSTE